MSSRQPAAGTVPAGQTGRGLAPEQELKDLLRKQKAEKEAFATCSALVAAVPSCQMLANAVSVLPYIRLQS